MAAAAAAADGNDGATLDATTNGDDGIPLDAATMDLLFTRQPNVAALPSSSMPQPGGAARSHAPPSVGNGPRVVHKRMVGSSSSIDIAPATSDDLKNAVESALHSITVAFDGERRAWSCEATRRISAAFDDVQEEGAMPVATFRVGVDAAQAGYTLLARTTGAIRALQERYKLSAQLSLLTYLEDAVHSLEERIRQDVSALDATVQRRAAAYRVMHSQAPRTADAGGIVAVDLSTVVVSSSPLSGAHTASPPSELPVPRGRSCGIIFLVQRCMLMTTPSWLLAIWFRVRSSQRRAHKDT